MSDKIEAEILDVLGEEVDATLDTPLVVIEGTKGDPGKDGVSPTVSTAATTGGTKVTITDAKGSHEFVVKDGAKGADGVTPHIGDNGNWYLGSTDTGKPSRGATGAPGKDGADGKPGAAGADGITPTIGSNGNWYLGATDTGKPSRGATGAPGKDGHSPVVTATKSGKTTTISVDGAAIATVEDGAKGTPGAPGAAGHTPVKGTDYWTAADKQEIVNNVLAALPDGTEVSY